MPPDARKLKIVATIGHFQLIHYVKIKLRWGSTPDPAGGAYAVSPRPPSWIQRALLLRGGEGNVSGEEGRESHAFSFLKVDSSAL